MKLLKNIGLFFLAPFIGLFYVCALPFVGLYMFINLAVERVLRDTSAMLYISRLLHLK
jgi:hypothetical protein